MKACSYVRVSSKSQIDGDGLDRQRKLIQNYAAQKGLEIVGEFSDEGVSGTLVERQGITAFLDSLNALGATVLLIERPDRLARDLIVGETIIAKLKEHGIRVIDCDGGEDLTKETPRRKFIRRILVAIAELDKDELVDKLRAGKAKKKAENGGSRCEGRIPFGLKPGETEVLQQIKSLRLGGATLENIANHLNQRGLRSRTGIAWSKGVIKKILDREPS